MSFRNFSIWRGRLPHWRADDVRYYVTFKHRRELFPDECHALFRMLLKPDGLRWDLQILCVLPAATELIFTVMEAAPGLPYELSEIVEKAKTKAGKMIIKRTGERFPPFYHESYDRIIRDEAEFAERWEAIFESAPGEDDDEYKCLWVASVTE